jgi:hypothetical protein
MAARLSPGDYDQLHHLGKSSQTGDCNAGTNARAVERHYFRSHRYRHVADAYAKEWQALSLLPEPDRS